MSKIDYKKIGLKCGIEIHQRLDTHKLFCSCPSVMIDDEKNVDVKLFRRQLRAVAGETGEIDAAAKHEMDRGTYFLYHYYPATNCLVELDEEPPQPLNKEALGIVLQVSKMLNAKVVDQVQVMRKTVINGSNTSGFQRTAFVGYGGHLEVSGERVGIPTLFIEEEAAKDISKGVDKDGIPYVEYGLDRLGIPLIEIATDPDIFTPEMCKATAEKIGMILRSTGKVARGLGTIRQDLNISVKEGRRVEIKGAQDLKMVPTLVDNECLRQLALVEIMKELSSRSFSLKKSKSVDVTAAFADTECKFVKKAISDGSIVWAFTLPGFSGMLGKETQPGKRLGTELSDYAKVKTGIGGMIHSDEDLAKYKFSDAELKKMKELLVPGVMEAFVMIVAEGSVAKSAMKFVIERAEMCHDGVPMEVRKANPDGTTTFMRPMPGAARMYPETDIPPIKPDISGVEVAELLTDKKARFKEKYGLSEDLARDLSKSPKVGVIEKFAERFSNVKPAFIAETMLSTPKTLRRKFNVDDSKLSDNDFEKIFSLLDAGKLTKDPVEAILISICKGENVDYDSYAPLSDEDLEKEIKEILASSSALEFKAVIGKVMGSLKGRAEGKKIMEMLKKLQG